MQRYGQESEFKDRLVAVNRVSKTVKGGRNMRFSALVVVGDEKGRVGAGMGKAAEIPEAIRKATEDAKKHLVTVPMDGTTIPHNTTGYFSTSKVVLLPAPEGTGVIAGGAARAITENAVRRAGVETVRIEKPLGCRYGRAARTNADVRVIRGRGQRSLVFSSDGGNLLGAVEDIDDPARIEIVAFGGGEIVRQFFAAKPSLH